MEWLIKEKFISDAKEEKPFKNNKNNFVNNEQFSEDSVVEGATQIKMPDFWENEKFKIDEAMKWLHNLFFDESFYSHLISESQRKIAQKRLEKKYQLHSKYKKWNISKKELQYYFMTFFFMGVCRLPSYKSYFSSKYPLMDGNEWVKRKFSFYKFQLIHRLVSLDLEWLKNYMEVKTKEVWQISSIVSIDDDLIRQVLILTITLTYLGGEGEVVV